jgi:peroxiredoxin Q/BCP
MKLPAIDKPAPDFEALDDTGQPIKLVDFRGQEIVLYFYPRADTPGCTKEACAFRDDYSAYDKADVVILGVSPDTVQKQAKFKEKWDLPFPLIADEDHSIAEAYGVWGPKKFMGREYEGVHRTTFIIDKDGKIKQIFENVKPAEHSQEILAAIRS